jgi:hypothetical protein
MIAHPFFPALLGLVATLHAVFAASDSKEMLLVEDGQAKSVIVTLEARLSPSEKTAVKELQKYVKQMSGATLEAVAPDKVPDGVFQIVLGNATVKSLYPDESLEGLGTDGFILKSVDGALLIAGGEQRGTMYGAFDLLERLGVRWWSVAVTDVPDKQTLTLPPLDSRQVPIIEYRDPLFFKPAKPSADGLTIAHFKAHNKINGFMHREPLMEYGGKYAFDKFDHNQIKLLGPENTFEKHPEYYAVRNGKPIKEQVCPSNPEVFDLMLASVRKFLTEHPENTLVFVGQEDNSRYCQCDKCAAIAEAEGTQGAANFLLTNRIAEVVEKEFPGKWVATFAYTWSRKPPKTIKMRDNVIILLCTIECDFNAPLADKSTENNKAFAGEIEVWSKLAKKLFIWDYSVTFNQVLLPFPNLDVLVPNIKFFADHNAVGILEQGFNFTDGGEFAQLREWVLAKALWNPDADGKALIKEFVDGYYGAAGKYILEYIDTLHAPGRKDPGMEAGCYSALDSAWLNPQTIADCEAILRQAELSVKDSPELLKRVQHAHLPIWYVLLKKGIQSKTWAATEAKVGTLNIADVARDFSEAVRENNVSTVGEREPMAGFLEWVNDYAAQAATGVPLPPELADADPKTYRLIQACQMDKRGRWWGKDAEASDGWMTEVPTEAWHTFIWLSPADDVEVGKTYKLFARVKASAPRPDGVAFVSGVYLDQNTKILQVKKIPASALPDDKYHAIEIGEFTATPKGQAWFALDKATDPKVFIDCIWVKEVP